MEIILYLAFLVFAGDFYAMPVLVPLLLLSRWWARGALRAFLLSNPARTAFLYAVHRVLMIFLLTWVCRVLDLSPYFYAMFLFPLTLVAGGLQALFHLGNGDVMMVAATLVDFAVDYTAALWVLRLVARRDAKHLATSPKYSTE